MAWDCSEVEALGVVLDRVVTALGPLDGKHALVLCSAAGDVAFRLAPLVGGGTVVGLELHEPSLARARARAAELGLGPRLRFGKAAKGRIPFPFGSFEALVSEFVVHPSPEPTGIGHQEMARVVRHGGRVVLTDVLAPVPLPDGARARMREAGLECVCDAAPATLRSRMEGAGLADVDVEDITDLVRPVWEARRARTRKGSAGRPGLDLLLGRGEHSLGRGVIYALASGHVH